MTEYEKHFALDILSKMGMATNMITSGMYELQNFIPMDIQEIAINVQAIETLSNKIKTQLADRINTVHGEQTNESKATNWITIS